MAASPDPIQQGPRVTPGQRASLCAELLIKTLLGLNRSGVFATFLEYRKVFEQGWEGREIRITFC